MSKGTLFDKVWAAHTVGFCHRDRLSYHRAAPDSRSHQPPGLCHAARTRPIGSLPERTVATVDHIVPTIDQARPFADTLAEEMMQALERNAKDTTSASTTWVLGVRELFMSLLRAGITQPGMTIACGDSHTATHGAFGAIAFGIGTSQVRDVLASQTLALAKLKVRKVEVNGSLNPGVYAKDVILHIIRSWE
jgi:3-isopropylmalate/(R)-2-methylmalate dehydratase large subunit